MQIRIDNIKNTPYKLVVNQPVESFPILAEIQSKGEGKFLDAVKAEICIQKEFDHFTATGSVRVPVELTCSRCLTPYTMVVEPSFTIIYRKETVQPDEGEDETELTEADLVSATYSGEELDLSHEIEMQVAMELPFKPLCNEECPGLCPRCGANLASDLCSCPATDESSVFSVLKNFKVSA